MARSARPGQWGPELEVSELVLEAKPRAPRAAGDEIGLDKIIDAKYRLQHPLAKLRRAGVLQHARRALELPNWAHAKGDPPLEEQ